MNRLIVSLLAGILAGCGVADAAEKPNVIHIVADDLGWKDVGFNGCADIRTPNLDKLARDGARFTQFYVQPMCTPTRAALFTGRYPFRYGLQTAVIPSVSAYGLDTNEWLLPQALKSAGYDTAIIGKWHLGHADRKWWPRQRGFDYQYGAMIGELDYFTHEEHGVLDWYRDNQQVREPGYTTELLGQDAVRYIERHDPATPFYLYLAFNAPHTPYQAPPEYIDRYKNIQDPTRRTYAAMVTCLDDQVGLVVSALEKKGLRGNTLILFNSDNGGTKNAMFAGVMADMSKVKIPCDNGPYRDGKGSLYEGATRVPAFANWPGHIQPEIVNGLIHIVDVYPTLAFLTGASTGPCKPLDGTNVYLTIAQANRRCARVSSTTSNPLAPRSGRTIEIHLAHLLPASVDLHDLSAIDPSEQPTSPPTRTASPPCNSNQSLSTGAQNPLFLQDQFKVVMRNMNGEPVLPTDEYLTRRAINQRAFGESRTHLCWGSGQVRAAGFDPVQGARKEIAGRQRTIPFGATRLQGLGSPYPNGSSTDEQRSSRSKDRQPLRAGGYWASGGAAPQSQSRGCRQPSSRLARRPIASSAPLAYL
ncbi:MAG: arylsulfatase [Verrucomicrobiota bacterium]